ncbi:MAG TPA: sulfatase-like hydrolase/transferase, partial [Chitinophagaceae bacterium]|nr:sulfatase-like hydrolase/transferase [Chitinophagaceae bacterium]
MKRKLCLRPTLKTAILLFLFPCTALFFASCQKADELQPVNDIAGSNASSLVATSKPNIVIILADDIGYDAIGRNGNQTFETPNIDLMGQKGMNFTQCYGSPLCSPSRTAFISGKYNFRNYTEWGVFDITGKTFANIAKDAGYATFVAGKWQFDGGDASIHSMGFDEYSLWDAIKEGPPGKHYKDPKIYENGVYLSSSRTDGKYGDAIFTNRLLSFINENKGKNFFVFFPITLCHAPYSPT